MIENAHEGFKFGCVHHETHREQCCLVTAYGPNLRGRESL